MHTNEEKFFYPRILGGGTPNEILAWGLAAGQTAGGEYWNLHMDNQLGAGRIQQSAAAYLRKGVTNHIEHFCQMNTPGQSDGINRTWINGVLVFDLTNVQYNSGGTQASWEGFYFAGVRGGGASGSLTPPGGQVRQYARLAVHASASLP
jgi:hypothetical protein